MKKFKVTCDKDAHSFGSTRIIVDELNNAAKNLDIYSEDELKLHYDCLGQNQGTNPDAYMVAYELPFPNYILKSCYPKSIIGLSRENISFAAYAGYPNHLLDYVTLGVNRKIWYPTEKKYMKDKFVFLGLSESNTRCGYEDLIPAFGEQFRNNKNVVLYLRDRQATYTFKSWVKSRAEYYNVEIIHDDRHLENWEEQIKIYEHADAQICVNHSHTFGMVVLQGISCLVPTIAIRYSGMTDYLGSLNASCVDFDVVNLNQEMLDNLVKIGMKNHLFQINNQNYPSMPFWAVARKGSLKQKMQEMIDNSYWRDTLRNLNDLTAREFSWEKTAHNLQFVLNKFVNK